MHPEDLRYTKSHEWVRTSDGEATVGITGFAQEELGDIVAVDLPSPGASVKAGEPFGSVDSVKSVSDLVSPVTGKVVLTNDVLTGTPEIINESPYDEGWLMIVSLADPAEVEGLMTADEYEAFLKQAG